MLILALTGGEILIAVSMGGIRSPQLVFFALPILFAGFLTGWRFSLVCAVVSLAALVTFHVLQTNGIVLPAAPDVNPHLSVLVIQTINLVSVASMVGLYESSRKRAFAQLGASEAKLAALVGNTCDAIWSVDRELEVIIHNQVFAQRFASDHRCDRWRPFYERAFAGEPFTMEVREDLDGDATDLEVSFNPICDQGEVTGVAIFARDISERKRQASKLVQAQRELVTASRMAGMAEVATGVLHNIGNALNSVKVSAGVIGERVRAFRFAGITKLSETVTRLDRERCAQYLARLGDQLQSEQQQTLDEMACFSGHLDRIATLVATHRAHAGNVNVDENVVLQELIGDAMRLAAGVVGRIDADLVPSNTLSSVMRLDRYKVTQILTNLIIHAASGERRIAVAGMRTAEGRIAIEVADDGNGIDPAEVDHIFRHGFGLHWSANAAKELGGDLSCRPGGAGQATTFRLELPAPPRTDCP
jgi:two-component system, LuxR family, sensor kinase FixL